MHHQIRTLRIASVCVAALAVGSALPGQTGWVQRSPQTQPSARGWHGLVYDLVRNVTVMFGGWDGKPLGDTWEWDGTDWALRQLPNSPPARCCHALAFDIIRGKVVLFGGTDGSSIDWNDTWEYDGTNWTQLSPQNRPIPRREHSMAYNLTTGTTLLFGGGKGGRGMPVYDDTWTWDGNNWTQHNPTTKPSARWSTGMTHDIRRGGIFMFGGAQGTTSTMNETWLWDGTDWSLAISTTPAPTLMHMALAQDLSGVMVVFGGRRVTVNMGETWLWVSGGWVRDSRLPAPSPRSSFSSAHDFVRGRTVLFGGWGGRGTYYGDTWEYKAPVLSQWGSYGSGCLGSNGTPRLAAQSSSRPVVGSTFVLGLTNLTGNGAAAISVGWSDQMWNGIQLPWGLTSIGMTGCSLYASPDFMFAVPVVSGRATLSIPVPNDPQLIGRLFYDQAFIQDGGANALGVIVSNAVAGLIGAF